MKIKIKISLTNQFSSIQIDILIGFYTVSMHQYLTASAFLLATSRSSSRALASSLLTRATLSLLRTCQLKEYNVMLLVLVDRNYLAGAVEWFSLSSQSVLYNSMWMSRRWHARVLWLSPATCDPGSIKVRSSQRLRALAWPNTITIIYIVTIMVHS